MEPTGRPQRHRRVPTRFLEAADMPVVSKGTVAPTLRKRGRQIGAPAQSNKRRKDAAPESALKGHEGCPAPAPRSSRSPLAEEVVVVAARAAEAPGGLGHPVAEDLALPSLPEAGQDRTTSDDSDVMIVEPPAHAKVGQSEGTSRPPTPQAPPGPASRRAPGDPGTPLNPPTTSPPVPSSPLLKAAKAPAAAAVTGGGTPLGGASSSPKQVDRSGVDQAEHGARSAAAPAQPSSPGALPPAGPGPVSPPFLPLFQREATPPRPDFSENDNASDSDSDDFDILAPRGRKGAKGAGRPLRRPSLLDSAASPAGSSPNGSAKGTPVRRSGAGDTSWLKLPSPDMAPRGSRSTALPESAMLLRLRQQRAELLALARGASLAPDRIQAQSAAEALERELEREAAQAAARAEVEVAAALRSGQAPNESDDDNEDAGGAAAHKQGGAAPSVLLKVRASDGSLERFKVRCGDPLEKLFRAYRNKVHPGGSPAGALLRFVFDGDPIDGAATPDELGLEDDDMIEVVCHR